MSEEEVPYLPITEVTKILSDEECPKISICIPCYKRQKFVPLILCNLIQMDYHQIKLK